MPRHRPRAAALLGATLTAAACTSACTSAGVTETPPTVPPTLPLTTRYYRADTTGMRAYVDSAGPDLHAGDLVLRADGTYAFGILVVPKWDGSSFSTGTWTQAGTKLTLTPTAGRPVQPWTLGMAQSALIAGDSVAFGGVENKVTLRIDTIVHFPGSGRFRAATPTGSALASGRYVLRVVNERTADTAGFVVGHYVPVPGRVDSTIRIAADTLTFSDGVFVRESWTGNTQFPLLVGIMTGELALTGAYDVTASIAVLRWYAAPGALTSVGYKGQFDSLAVHGDTLVRRSRDGQHPEYGLLDQRYVRVR